jgi:hypothetical protein
VHPLAPLAGLQPSAATWGARETWQQKACVASVAPGVAAAHGCLQFLCCIISNPRRELHCGDLLADSIECPQATRQFERAKFKQRAGCPSGRCSLCIAGLSFIVQCARAIIAVDRSVHFTLLASEASQLFCIAAILLTGDVHHSLCAHHSADYASGLFSVTIQLARTVTSRADDCTIDRGMGRRGAAVRGRHGLLCGALAK